MADAANGGKSGGLSEELERMLARHAGRLEARADPEPALVLPSPIAVASDDAGTTTDDKPAFEPETLMDVRVVWRQVAPDRREYHLYDPEGREVHPSMLVPVIGNLCDVAHRLDWVHPDVRKAARKVVWTLHELQRAQAAAAPKA